jgi:phosphopantothenoylcysteine decarboxylase/phosphopantothenate--cysteine ligase
MNKKILLIITGSIAAYKSLDLIRLLKKKNYQVDCILTKAASEFITPLLASSILGKKVYSELFSNEDEAEMGHINLSRKNDLILIAPASADFIAKIANGYADDLASATVLASNKKIMIAPAMNEKMWHNQMTQKNIENLIDQGNLMIEPESDILACGEFGVGKMALPEKISKKIDDFFLNENLFSKKNILITGGGTIEPIDLVRFIGNRSSGKQAIEIAKYFTEKGANVKFISANISQKIPLAEEKIIKVETADQMFLEVKKNLRSCDIFIACAAVADFKVKNFSKKKIKKSLVKNPKIELALNVDILDYVGNLKKERPKIVIGFAAENDNLEKYAKEKLQKKNCDLIVGNEIEKGKIFGNHQTSAILVSKKSVKKLGKISKIELAEEIGRFLI